MLLAAAPRSGDPDVGEGLPGEGEVALHILADDRLLVVASNIVPFDAWNIFMKYLNIFENILVAPSP